MRPSSVKHWLVIGCAAFVALPAIMAAAAPSEHASARGSDRVSIDTRDRVLRRGQTHVILFGSVESGRANEPVTIEGKECGPHAPSFRQAVATHTRAGGGWSTQAFVHATTAFRARSGDALSTAVTVQARPGVFLRRDADARQFEVRVTAVANFWRKRVEIQRYDRRVGTWIKLRSVVLTDNTYGGSPSTTFTLRVPKRTLLRAVFPLSQARPCYLAGYSSLLRT